MCFAPRQPKTTVFTMLFASGNKNNGIYSVFWPVPSKNTGIYFTQFSACCKKYFFHAKGTKTL